MIPTPWKLTRNILKVLKSSLSPNQIALSFSLGVFAGIPPVGLHIILPITLALLIRCSFRSFLLAMGLFKLTSLALTPVSYAIGRFFLDPNRGLDPLWRTLFHLPIIAPMGYGRYLLFGSVVLSFILAIPVFWMTRVLVLRYRDGFVRRVSNWSLAKRLRNRRGIGILQWLFTGGKAKYLQQTRKGPFRWIRKEMLAILPGICAICYLFAALVIPFFVGRIATSAASFLVGSEVAVEESTFNLFTGRLNLTGFSIQDPKRPEENVLEIPALTLDAGMLPLLAKRVVFNSLGIDEISLHVEREADGTLNVDNFTSGWDVEGYLEWAAQYANQVDWLDLVRHFTEHLLQPRPVRSSREDRTRYQGGRSFIGFYPSFALERLQVGRLHIAFHDTRTQSEGLPPVTLIEVEIKNLALPASLNRDVVELNLVGRIGEDPNPAFLLNASFNDHGNITVHTYELELRELDLVPLSQVYETTLPVEIRSGKVTLTATATITGRALLGEISLLAENLRLALAPGKTLFEFSPGVSAYIVEGINHYTERFPMVIGFLVDGERAAPKLHWEGPLLETARQGLLMEGRRELQGVIDQLGVRIDALGLETEVPLSSGYAKLREQVEMAATELIHGTGTPFGNLDFTPSIEQLLQQLVPLEKEETQ
jgi:uncharacterized protein (TIGR03546 family)